MLESVGAHEPHVDVLRENIRKCIHQALIPLRAYLKRYEKFRALAELNMADYLKLVVGAQELVLIMSNIMIEWINKIDLTIIGYNRESKNQG